VAIDIDPQHYGDVTLAELQQRLGPLPETVSQRTPNGGRHLLFAYPEHVSVRQSAGRLGTGIDVRSDGGYIVIAPSRGANGNSYEWENAPSDAPLAELPSAWLVELASDRQQGVGPNGAGMSIPTGQRNAKLTSLGGAMRRVGSTENEIRAALREANDARC
jgi:hypothetical protein